MTSPAAAMWADLREREKPYRAEAWAVLRHLPRTARRVIGDPMHPLNGGGIAEAVAAKDAALQWIEDHQARTAANEAAARDAYTRPYLASASYRETPATLAPWMSDDHVRRWALHQAAFTGREIDETARRERGELESQLERRREEISAEMVRRCGRVIPASLAAQMREEQRKLSGSDWVMDAAINRGKDRVRAAGMDSPASQTRRKPGFPELPVLERARCGRWWVRAARRKALQITEAANIATGHTSRKAGLYVSDAVFGMWQEQRRRNAKTLAGLYLMNEAGELMRGEGGQPMTLAEAAALSTANPALRRVELMTRAGALEDYACDNGHIALFVTWTLPSAYHARISKTGAINTNWDGLTPKDGQRELRRQWANARRQFHREGVRPYGIRVAEPHHDGCPHWHLLLYVKRRDVATVRRIIRREALRESPGEAGAQLRRVTFKELDPTQGHSGTAYLAKYVAKNIDGYSLEETTTQGDDGQPVECGGNPLDNAQRVAAWASCWSIRQFQFFGTAPVTIWRELRRLREPVADPLLEAFRAAADAGDYAKHLRQMGGANRARELQALRTRRRLPELAGRYGERAPKTWGLIVRSLWAQAKGLLIDDGICTRPESWQVVESSELLTAAARQRGGLGPVSITVPPAPGAHRAAPVDKPHFRPPPAASPPQPEARQ